MEILFAQQVPSDVQVSQWELRFSPPWFWGFSVLLGLIAVVLVLWFYLRESEQISRGWRIVLAGIRLGVVALILFMLYGAAIHPYRIELPTLIVLLDNSRSMSLTDVRDSSRAGPVGTAQPEPNARSVRSRWDRGLAWLLSADARRLQQWMADYRVQIRTLDGEILSTDEDLSDVERHLRRIQPNVPSSPLGTAVQAALETQRGRSTAAMLILTDGNTSEGMTLADVAASSSQQGVPLFPIGIGRQHPPPDLALTDLLVDRVAFVDDLLTFDVAVTANGLERRTVQLSLRQEDEPGEFVREAVVLPSNDYVGRVRLVYRPQKAGQIRFVVQANTLPEESRTDNNSLRVTVQVRDESIRVLLVQSVPSFEYRYLNSLMGRQIDRGDVSRDPVIELTTILQEADPEYAASEPSARTSVPWTREDLRQYDVVIWGDVNPGLVNTSSLQHLFEFVNDDGRGLILISGPRYGPRAWLDTPLEPLLPFSRSDLSANWAEGTPGALQLTAVGRAMPALQLATDPEENVRIWNGLPRVHSLTSIRRTRPGVRVLVTCRPDGQPSDTALPAISLQYVGAGKVVFHAMDETYRWRFRQGDTWFGRYWPQMIRFLGRAKLGEDQSTILSVDQERYEWGETVRMRAEFIDDREAPADTDEAVALLEDDRGRQQRVNLIRTATSRGQFAASVDGLAVGNYRAWIAEPVPDGEPPACNFSVLSSNRELQHLTVDERDLRLAAARSGGHFFRLEDAAQLARELPAGKAVRVESLEPIQVWNSWRTAALFVALLTSEWLLRRWLGMN